jgi:hypothetical protein
MLKETLGRRNLLKRLGIGALVAPAVGKAALSQEQMMKFAAVDVGSGALNITQPSAPIAKAIFTLAGDFSKWWELYGKLRAKQNLEQVRALDPDIAGFRLPLQTKVNMQRERNYKLMKKRMKENFIRSVLRAPYHEWGDDGPAPAYNTGSSRSLG